MTTDTFSRVAKSGKRVSREDRLGFWFSSATDSEIVWRPVRSPDVTKKKSSPGDSDVESDEPGFHRSGVSISPAAGFSIPLQFLPLQFLALLVQEAPNERLIRVHRPCSPREKHGKPPRRGARPPPSAPRASHTAAPLPTRREPPLESPGAVEPFVADACFSRCYDAFAEDLTAITHDTRVALADALAETIGVREEAANLTRALTSRRENASLHLRFTREQVRRVAADVQATIDDGDEA